MFRKELGNKHGSITVAYSLGIVAALTPDYFFRFNEKYPNIYFETTEISLAHWQAHTMK